MKPVYIISPYRSAVAKAFRGSFANKRPDDLCADVIKGVMAKTPTLDPSLIEDVVIGCAMPEAEQGMNIARFALLLAGLPDTVPGMTINRFCSSGLQAIAIAYQQIAAGQAECVMAGGTESMTMIPMMGHEVVGSREVMTEHPEFYLSMGLTAENVAKDYKVSREDQDRFSFESHQKAVQAIEKGYFKNEIIPVEFEHRSLGKNAEAVIKRGVLMQDEGPRMDTTLEALAKLRAVFLTGGSVTAGNSSQMSDGAAACIVASESFVKKHNLKPMARMCGFSVAGVPPRIMGIGPIEAIPKALKLAGITMKQIERIELNEAFAAQALAVTRELKLDPKMINPTGGAIALGHPLGATGAKLAATLIHGMHRDNQKYGIVSMCIGTGMGAAGVFEKV